MNDSKINEEIDENELLEMFDDGEFQKLKEI